MIASLGMYDRAETAAAHDALWSAVRAQLGYGPPKLDRETVDMEVWTDPDLVLSQTCGMPYRTMLHGRVQIVGSPVYDLPDVAPGYYQSVFVARKGDAPNVRNYRDRVLAYNDAGSQSGWAAPQNHANGLGFQFMKLYLSGGHNESVLAVVNQWADIAAIDIVTWKLICAHDAIARELSVVGQTPQTPGLPFITGPSRDAAQIYRALETAIAGLDETERRALMLQGMTRIEPETYLAVANPAPPVAI